MNYDNLIFYNGYGGFNSKQNEYVIDGSRRTPLAWSNVISSVSGYPFGFIITESGGGYVWKYNSRENRITPWHGNCAFDVANEWVEFTMAYQSQPVSVRLICENDYACFGWGYSTFHKEINGVETKVTVFVPENDPVKLTLVEITPTLSDAVIDVKYHANTCENSEIFVKSAFESQQVKIKQNQTFSICYMLGQEALDKQGSLIDKYSDVSYCKLCLDSVKEKWRQLLSKIQIQSEDKDLDCLMNGWLIYQAISCRVYTRSSMYQSGGAFGYRDQLQDTLGINYIQPEISRSLIINHARHQYSSGNVLHWWHSSYEDVAECGVDSSHSDDMLWLVYCTYRYIVTTGDKSILYENISYLDDDTTALLFNHCMKSIDYASEYGRRGLPLIRGGDWNDGMNNVGKNLQGESVWLAWFLVCCLDAITKMSLMMDEAQKYSFERKLWTERKEKLIENINEYCWDGKWYVRAFTDDDEKIGSRFCDECKIDSISQSWSVLSTGGCTEEYDGENRSKIALDSAAKYLFDEDSGLVSLLWPPFSPVNIDKIGYIAAYPAGIRENGAYTHAAVWLARAMLLTEGFQDVGYKILKAVNPINHTKTRGECFVYKVEPYVIAADIYSQGRNKGRGGWTWYTGSASWYYITILESLFGFEIKGDTVEVCSRYPYPVVIKYKYLDTQYIFRIKSMAKGRFPLENTGIDTEILVK